MEVLALDAGTQTSVCCSKLQNRFRNDAMQDENHFTLDNYHRSIMLNLYRLEQHLSFELEDQTYYSSNSVVCDDHL